MLAFRPEKKKIANKLAVLAMAGMEYAHQRDKLSAFGKKLLDSHEVQEGLKSLKQVVHRADLSTYVLDHYINLFLIAVNAISFI